MGLQFFDIAGGAAKETAIAYFGKEAVDTALSRPPSGELKSWHPPSPSIAANYISRLNALLEEAFGAKLAVPRKAC